MTVRRCVRGALAPLRPALVLFLATLGGLSVLGPEPAGAAAPAPSVATWIEKSVDHIDARYKGQGFATVEKPDGTTSRYYTGDDSVPPFMVAAGWNHNGDPDSAHGYIFEAYQASDGGATEKLFHVTAPDGTMTDHIHQNIPGERMNNSFAAITPDAQWMVSGEFDEMTRLLIMPTPILNPGAPGPADDLPVTGLILLDKTVVDIQGCDFQTPTRLFCTSDDHLTRNGIPRKALLQLDLAHPIDGGDVEATVSVVFALPVPPSTCPIESPGSWPTDIEIEGIDHDRRTGVLGVVILPPRWCALNSRVYNYTSPQATATALAVDVPATATTGTKVTATVTARDVDGATVPQYRGTVDITTTDPAAQVPATVTLVDGTATITATFLTPGSHTIHVADTVVASIAGTSAPVTLSAPAPTSTSTSTTSTTSTSTTTSTAAPTTAAGAPARLAPPGPTAGPPVLATGALPATGLDVRPLLGAAAVLVGGGALLVRRARRLPGPHEQRARRPGSPGGSRSPAPDRGAA